MPLTTLQKSGNPRPYLMLLSKKFKPLNINISSLDVRDATHHIIKSCEEKLSIIRQTFLDENVSTLLADRYLKMSRTQTTRTTLKHLMFLDAAKKMGYPGAK